MRIVLIGPPDSGKQKFAKTLGRKYKNLSIANGPEDIYRKIFKAEDKIPALGLLSDYRSELLLASYRACDMIKNDDRIFTHSVLDNVLYSMAITSMKISNNTIDQRWVECIKWFPYLANDSFMADIVIRFDKKEDSELMKLFNENIEFILQYYCPDYINSTDLYKIYKTIDLIIEGKDESTQTRTN